MSESKRAFAYLRVSGRDQVKGDGFPRQREAIKKHAQANGLRVVRWFEEKGVSGDLESRRALDEMLSALTANGVEVVVIERLDRLARDLMIQESIISTLRKGGFELQSAHEPDLCSEDPARVLFRQMMGGLAQYEKAMIVRKLRAARQRVRASGARCEGRKPYGHRPGEREVRERVQAMRAAGETWAGIAEQLNAEGVKTRCGGSWYPSTLCNLFSKRRVGGGR
jgi:DNA invertase Pin-like site-specific DNA recombinase